MTHQPQTAVSSGDMWRLGRHRLLCADATSHKSVATLLHGQSPNLVLSSPPYLNQRHYDSKIADWEALMEKAFNQPLFADNAQVLINLGIIHRKSVWTPYWQPFVEQMKAKGWRHFGMYVWDKQHGVPGRFGGRLSPSFEFILHFNKKALPAAKTVPCYSGRTSPSRANMRKKDGLPKRGKPKIISASKLADSVIRLGPVRYGEATGHPAQMPKALANFLLPIWMSEDSIVFDPFAGSGTTLLASEDCGVTALGVEISPNYCQLAINRWNAAHPSMPAAKECVI